MVAILAMLDRETLIYRHVTKKGYVRLHTSLGDVNLELHCDVVPRTCHNFIKHCRDGYYNGTSEKLLSLIKLILIITANSCSLSSLHQELHGKILYTVK